MSEGLTQSHRTINIVTLPRITPKSTSKIASPDYPHDFTDVAVGKSTEPISPRHRRENVENWFRGGSEDRRGTGKYRTNPKVISSQSNLY